MATTAVQQGGGGGVQRSGGSGELYAILDLILDKGLVIDVFVRVSLVGIELLTIDVRVVIASVDTYLRFAEAANRLDLQASRGKGLSDLTGDLTGGLNATDALGDAQGALAGATQAGSGLAGGATQLAPSGAGLG